MTQSIAGLFDSQLNEPYLVLLRDEEFGDMFNTLSRVGYQAAQPYENAEHAGSVDVAEIAEAVRTNLNLEQYLNEPIFTSSFREQWLEHAAQRVDEQVDAYTKSRFDEQGCFIGNGHNGRQYFSQRVCVAIGQALNFI